MMDFSPRNREVFKMPLTAANAGADATLPASWAASLVEEKSCAGGSGAFREEHRTVSVYATNFVRKSDGAGGQWHLLDDLGLAGSSLVLGEPGRAESFSSPEHRSGAPWVEYEFSTASEENATLRLSLLPVFPVDSEHRQRFAVQIDGQSPRTLDMSGAGEWKENSAPTWSANVLRNAAIQTVEVGRLKPGWHTLRLIDIDPGLIFEAWTLTFPGAPPAYPLPPETRCGR